MSIQAPQLDRDSYAEFYELRKAASSMTPNTIEWLGDHAKILLEKCLHTNRPLSVLSVGSGEGDIDMELIRALLPHMNSQTLEYDALEPNPVHHQGFAERLNTLSFGQRVRVSLYDKRLEEFNTTRQYDVVLLIHVLYYFEDPYLAIRRALSRTKPGGQVIIIHQSAEGIPQIQRKHMYELKHNENEMLTADDIKNFFDKAGDPYRFCHIDAHLDVTECLRQSEIGLKIMSFCMECDLRQTDADRLTRLTRSFSELAKTGKDDSLFIYEPLVAFLLEKTKSAGDKDPVEDYRQIAQKFGWIELLLNRKTSDIRLLDVACGTGRWLQAFRTYVKPECLNINIVCDAVDPSKQAVQSFVERIASPMSIGCRYEDTIQNTDLPKDVYDIIWSMHGFYAIPREDLHPVLKKIYDSLNSGGGEAFIAQAARNSFYIQFYDKFLDAFNPHEQGFTSAEDITDALNMLGLNYQIHIIAYDECIAVNDLEALEHYILKESVSNSFMQEEWGRKNNRTIGLNDILDHPALGTYLRSFIKNEMYCFPQEIWLISFAKKKRYPDYEMPACFNEKKSGNLLLPREKEMYELVGTAMKYIVRCQSETDVFPLNGSGFKWVHSERSGNDECEKMLKLAKTLEEPLPETGAPDFEKILDDLFCRLAPYSTNDNSGGYLAYIPGGGLFHAALADFISLSLNRYVTMFMAAPGLAAIEEQAVRWLCDIAGFPRESGGVITSGGSAATFTAIHTARTAMLSGENSKHFSKATAYVSSETHLCIEQGLVLCGFPRENVRKIEVDENFRIQTDLLEQTIERDRAAGYYPFLLVGNAGTTNTGAVDDLTKLEKMARRYHMWFHADAAYGGFFMLTQKGQELMKGIEKADSIVLDPHKSLFLPYGTGTVLAKDKTNLLKAFDFTGTYLPPLGKQGAADTLPDDIMYCSQEVTRDFRGFRIWLPLKMLGIKPFREQLEEKLKLARQMAAQLSELPNIRILSQPQLSIVAFKLEPRESQISSEVLDEINKLFLDAINRRGNIFLSPFKSGVKGAGQFALRMAILSHRTNLEHLRQGLIDIRESADEVLTLIQSN